MGGMSQINITNENFVASALPPLSSAASQCSPKSVESYQAFLRELPTLLERHPGKWVAYSGSTFLGVNDSRRQLYRELLDAGHSLGDFLICAVEQPQEVVLDGLLKN
jgi:hypothetical protein